LQKGANAPLRLWQIWNAPPPVDVGAASLDVELEVIVKLASVVDDAELAVNVAGAGSLVVAVASTVVILAVTVEASCSVNESSGISIRDLILKQFPLTRSRNRRCSRNAEYKPDHRKDASRRY
jgi:hypothetical protein